jgi:hypothetical protein
MNGTTAHWTAGENAAMLSPRGEKPLVETVVNAWATASYSVISGARPTRWRPYSVATWSAVRPT